MKRNHKIAPAVLLLALASMGFACQNTATNPDAGLASVAKGLDEAAHTIAVLQTTVIEAEKQKLVTEAQARTIMEGSMKANQAGQQATAITRSINALDPASRGNLLNILNPVIASVNELVVNGTVGITNADTKQKIQLGLLTLQSILNAIHLTLAAQGGN